MFVQPFASGWSLPVYELAIMAAVQRTGTQITVVTAETAPLWVFGEQDAEVGDFKQAVHALDVAAALTGGVLPAGWALRREAWLAGHA